MAQFFIRRPIVAIVIAVLTVLLGTATLLRLSFEQYPFLAPPTIRVTATYPGASAVAGRSSAALTGASSSSLGSRSSSPALSALATSATAASGRRWRSSLKKCSTMASTRGRTFSDRDSTVHLPSALSTGIYSYPPELTAPVAVAAVRPFEERFDEIRFVFLDEGLRRTFDDAAKALDG